jgi:hypothetical protein
MKPLNPPNPPPAGTDPAIAVQMRIMQQMADTMADMHTQMRQERQEMRQERERGDVLGEDEATIVSPIATTATSTSTPWQAPGIYKPQAAYLRQLSRSSAC